MLMGLKYMLRRTLLAASLLGTVVSTSSVHADDDVERGQSVFKRCAACHVVDQPKNRVGPHLVGLFGRESGSVEGFAYSSALRGSGIVWDEQQLDAYLENPRKHVKGTRMAFAGLKDPQDRQDVIAYLKQATPKD
jgi:cytochrome c